MAKAWGVYTITMLSTGFLGVCCCLFWRSKWELSYLFVINRYINEKVFVRWTDSVGFNSNFFDLLFLNFSVSLGQGAAVNLLFNSHSRRKLSFSLLESKVVYFLNRANTCSPKKTKYNFKKVDFFFKKTFWNSNKNTWQLEV